MKINLLKDGGYGDMENVKFPVEVEAKPSNDGFGFDVPSAELVRVGATEVWWDRHQTYYFSAELGECEVVE